MAQIIWNGAAGDGNFFTAGNWIGGMAPGPNDDAVILAAVTVQASGGSVNTLSLGAKTIVVVGGSDTFTIAGAATSADPTGTSTMTGLLQVSDNAIVNLDGTLAGTGTLALASAGNNTNLVIGASGATLQGGGTIALGDATNANRIYGASGTDVLVNVDDTIEGSGQFGLGQLLFTNKGLVDATGTANGLVLNAVTTNTGTIEATGPAGLSIQNTVTNEGGLIRAVGTSSVMLDNGSDIIGGTLTTLSGGLDQLIGSNTGTLDGSAGVLMNAGALQIDDNATLNLYGTIDNTGTITLASGGNDTNLVVAGTTATLTGGGTIVMGDATNANRIYGASGDDILVNVDNTIEGSGELGAGSLVFTNEALVDATGKNNGLVLSVVTTNTGTIEATGAAGLSIQSTVDNAKGVIKAAGKTSVMLDNGADIVGGTLTSSAGGIDQLIGSNTGALDGSAGVLTNAGALQIDDNATLNLTGTIDNTGTITLASGGNDTNLVAAGSLVTLTGGGRIVLGDAFNANRIYGASGTNMLVNVDNTIEGSGQLGAGSLMLTNEAVVDATGTLNGLVLNAITTNTGTIEATGPAGLSIVSTVDNAKGLIEAVGKTSVMLDSGSDVIGGTLTTLSGGLDQLIGSNTGTLDGSSGALTNAGALQIDDNATLDLYGTIDNAGTITLASGGNDTNLVATGSTVTFDGGGTIVLGDATNANRIYGASGGDALVNVDNTIEGSGQLGAGSLVFTNEALVDAIGTANGLVLNALTTNTGTIETTGPAGLSIQSTVTNIGGLIQAVGTSSVLLDSGSDLVGGTLTTSMGGLDQLVGSSTGTIDGSAGVLTNAGALQVDDNATLALYGTLHNTGTITLASAGNDTNLVVAGTTVTLTGGGTIRLGDATNANRIYGASGGDTLVNEGNTIEGIGQIGVGQLTLDNSSGKIIAENGALDLNATLSHGGSLVIAGPNSELEINTTDPDGSVTFAGTDDTLQLDTPNSFAATLAGLAGGGVIALEGDTATGAVIDGTTLAITLNDGVTLDYALAAPIPGATAMVTPFGGGTDVTIVAAPCFAAGTRILTTRGEVPVEALAIGDRVVTPRNRSSRPIVWLGRRRVHCDRHPDRRLADPVRVRAGAFGVAPTRDLVLSPDHAIWFGGALVPVNLLIDGKTIIQERRSTVTYHHVELDAHDIILAEGLPAESYLDTGNRSRFANTPLVALHPRYVAEADWPGPCAPMVLDGPRLARIRNDRAAVAAPAALVRFRRMSRT